MEQTNPTKLPPPGNRVAFTLAEFAALFGKKRLWAYRQMWAHKIKVIEDFGPPMVPASEVNRLQRRAHFFSGDAVGSV
jgi:hypothetical protein